MSRKEDRKKLELLLENYNLMKESIDNMKLELKEISTETGLRAITNEQESVSKTNKITSITEDTAIRNIEYSDVLKKKIDITESKLKRIDNSLKQLTGLEKDIIQMKDIDQARWITVTEKLPCGDSTARRLRKNALNKLAICLYGDTSIQIPINNDIFNSM